MNAVGVILRGKFRMAAHGVASVRTESRLKVGVISVAVVLIWIGVFAAFYFGFRWVLHFGIDRSGASPAIGSVILVRMLSILMLATFFMLVFSNILVSFSTFYGSREVTFLLHTPISIRAFFVARFAECVAFSSWALAYLGSPLLLAFGLASHASWMFYVACALFFLPFVTLPAAVGSIITMALARVFPRLRMRSVVGLGVLAVGALFFYWRQRFGAARLSNDTFLPALLDMSSQTQSPFLPSYWMARGLFAAVDGNVSECGFNLLVLLSNALLLVWVAGEVAQRFFYLGWSMLAGTERARSRPLGRGILGRVDGWLSILPNPARALVVKDIKLFWRDPAQWSQFVIFFGIMAVYVANLHNTGYRYQQEFWKSWIACLNSGACMLVLATLTSRFVFPLVSLEGRRFWILGLAPLTFKRLVLQKFWLSVIITSFFTVTVAVLSAHMLKLDPVYYFLTVYSVVVSNFGLSGLAVGLGKRVSEFPGGQSRAHRVRHGRDAQFSAEYRLHRLGLGHRDLGDAMANAGAVSLGTRLLRGGCGRACSYHGPQCGVHRGAVTAGVPKPQADGVLKHADLLGQNAAADGSGGDRPGGPARGARIRNR